MHEGRWKRGSQREYRNGGGREKNRNDHRPSVSFSLSLSLSIRVSYTVKAHERRDQVLRSWIVRKRNEGERERERGRGLRCWILSTISDRVVSVSLHVRATTLTDAFFSAAPLTSSTAYTRCSASTCYDPNYDFVYLCYLIFPFPLQFFISWIFELLYEFRSIKWIKILK